MAEKYRIHPGTGIVLFQGGGLVRYDDWAAAVQAALLAAGSTGVRRILSDRRGMAGSYPPGIEEQVAEFFREHAREMSDVKWAVVLAGQAGARETVELAGRLSRGSHVRLQVFTNLALALGWLLGAYEEADITELVNWVGDITLT